MKKIISLVLALALVAPATSFAQSTSGATATSGSTAVNAGTLTGAVTAGGGSATAQQTSSATLNNATTLDAHPTSDAVINQNFQADKPSIIAPPPLMVSTPPAVAMFYEPTRLPANASGVPLENAFLGACAIGDIGPNDFAVQKVESDFATVEWTSLPGLRTASGPYDTVVNFSLPSDDSLRYNCVGMITVIAKPGADFGAVEAAAKDFVFKRLPKNIGRVYLVSVYEALTATTGVGTTGKGLGLSGSSDGLVGGATALLGLNAGIGSSKGTTSPFAQVGTTFVAVVLTKDGGVPLNQKILTALYHLPTVPSPAATPTSAAASAASAPGPTILKH